ncbi:PAQR family membrane homeostasis protein TrhA [Romboutsia sp.]|uniref:PAQR family membrane homeostasis protein TrhA n=1 Tax=Romboutsia sp. TaxID=1965302 RepID=UPI002CD33CAC|nr:hemolysin III family protein [Romboutsia sp.]HSQ89701.1 hemolysin III family protein [Romboutsia sp.]
MKDIEIIKYYSPIEEKINITTHAIGFILSIVAFVLLVTHANLHGDVWHIVSFSIFGASLIILYAASTFYHSAKKSELRNRLKIFDHASIYILIAGTYTPFTLVTLNGTIGWVIFGTSWGLALTGIILKFFFTGKYNLISTIMYVLMGWVIVFAIKPLINNLPLEGLLWLLAGGIFYTIGAILYSIKKIKFNHAIFHMFVLSGSFCQFMSVFFYVLPSE